LRYRPPAPKLENVATYSQYLGHRVSVQYWVGDVLLSASGTFSGDSGRSIFLEQHVELRGKRNYFRWEIPYPYIHRIESRSEMEVANSDNPTTPNVDSIAKAAAAGARESAGGAPSAPPFPWRPKTA
jgi:hypothetical protein